MDWSLAIGNIVINGLDVVVFIFIIAGAVGGALEGFASAFSSKAGYIVALAVGLMFTKLIAPLLQSRFGLSPFASSIISYVALFYVGFLLTQAFGSWLTKILEGVGLGPVNTVLGFIWGIAVMVFILIIILLLLENQELIPIHQLTDNSYFVTHMMSSIMPQVQQELSQYV